VNDIPKIT